MWRSGGMGDTTVLRAVGRKSVKVRVLSALPFITLGEN